MGRLSAIAIVLLAASWAASARAADLEPITAPNTLPQFETFQHLAMNAKGQFVAVSDQKIFVGDSVSKTITQVLAAARVNFVLTDLAIDQQNRLDFSWVGTRLAINERGDYVVASNTQLYSGNAAGGQPAKVYEDPNAFFQRVLINDAGHYLGISSKSLVGGQSGSNASVLLARCIGLFDSHGLGVLNNNWTVETGETHATLNATGHFVAISSGAVYAGSVPGATAEKILELPRTNLKHVAIAATGEYVLVTAKTVYRGKLE